MRYADWNKLTAEEKRQKHWKHHPHMRTATVFTILAALFFAIFMMGVFRNKRMHVNRNPNAKEAYSAAKMFVADKLKQPQTAIFPKSNFEANVDTAKNSYIIMSTVDAQDSSGKTVTSHWEAHLSYTGGDWADRKSWRVAELKINRP